MRAVIAGLVLAGLAAVPAHAADGATCQGKPATIVRAEGVVEGTKGDDVIIGGSKTEVRACGGADTVCVAGGVVDGGPDSDSVEARGTEGADRLVLEYVEVVDVQTGEGPDRVVIRGEQLTGELDGGPGEDLVSVEIDENVTVNLARGRLTLGPHQHASLAGFENAAADTFSGGRIVGDEGDNRLWLTSNYDCGGVVLGGPGDDVITSWRTSVHETCRGITAYGGPGDDLLTGSAFNDVLVGGPGRDRARGRDDEGRDFCRAEIRSGCEAGRPQ